MGVCGCVESDLIPKRLVLCLDVARAGMRVRGVRRVCARKWSNSIFI